MPKRFVFRLQPVLEQRERIEEELQRRFAEIQRERLGCEERLRQIQSDIADAREQQRRRLHAPGTAPDRVAPTAADIAGARQAATASLHLTVRAQRAAMELAGIMSRQEAARRELLRAAADRKAVQLLKERAMEEFRQAGLKREAAELDEMMVMRHGARDASGVLR